MAALRAWAGPLVRSFASSAAPATGFGVRGFTSTIQARAEAPIAPKGSTVLLTGGTGSVGTHIAAALLKAGYKVRGTTRNVAKTESIKATLEKVSGVKGKLEYIQLSEDDLQDIDKVRKAVKGCGGIVHSAMNMSFSPNRADVIPGQVKSIETLLQAASENPSVKRFVYTSSSTSAKDPENPTPNRHFTKDSYFWKSVEISKQDPSSNPYMPWHVYGAAKIECEQAAKEFMEKNKPGFAFNTLVLDACLGPIYNPASPSSSQFIVHVFTGDKAGLGLLRQMPDCFYVDLRDVGALHAAGCDDPTFNNERVWAAAARVSYNEILDEFKKEYPDRQFVDKIDEAADTHMRFDNERGAELLRRRGQDGWRPLRETVIDTMTPILSGELKLAAVVNEGLKS